MVIIIIWFIINWADMDEEAKNESRSQEVRLMLEKKPPLLVRYGNVFLLFLIALLSVAAWHIYSAYGL